MKTMSSFGIMLIVFMAYLIEDKKPEMFMLFLVSTLMSEVKKLKPSQNELKSQLAKT